MIYVLTTHDRKANIGFIDGSERCVVGDVKDAGGVGGKVNGFDRATNSEGT